MEVQLRVLQENRLADIPKVLEDCGSANAVAFSSSSQKAHRALQKLSGESLECIIAAVRHCWVTHGDTFDMCRWVSKLLELLDNCNFRREILAEELLKGTSSRNWEYVQIHGQEPDSLDAEEKALLTEKIQELLAHAECEHNARILLARGSLWIIIGATLSSSDKQLFQQRLQEHILDRKAGRASTPNKSNLVTPCWASQCN